MTALYKHLSHWVLIVAFGLMIFFPFAFLLINGKTIAVETDSFKSTTKGIETYVSDSFGFRKFLIRVNNKAHVAMGISPHDEAVLGKEGWLFLNQSYMNDQYSGKLPYRENQLAEQIRGLTETQAWLSERGIAFVVVMAPEKQSVYPEYLPSFITKTGPSRSDVFRREIRNTSLHFLDIFPLLSKAKSGPFPPYYSTDSHWNRYGAYLAGKEINQFLKTINIEVDESWKVTFEGPFERETGRDIARNILGIPESFQEKNAVMHQFSVSKPVLYERLEDGFQTKAFYKMYNARQTWKAVRQETTSRKPVKAVVIRDSFGNALSLYLNQSFDEVVYFYRHGPFPKEFIESYKPDVVIHEFVERGLIQSLIK